MWIDKLNFKWDRKASKSNKQKKMDLDDDKPRSLEKYFEFLSEIRPHQHELEDVRIFKKPFTLV
jgi:hypothetical protein